MASYKTDALVLRKRKLGEADNVLILASVSEGRIDAIARGVRKTKSRFGGRLEPFGLVRLVLSRGRTFDSISTAEVLDGHDAIRQDATKIAYAAPVLDVLDKVLVRDQAEPRLVAMANATLGAMDADDAHLAPLLIAYALKAMAMLGLRPAVAACISCAEDPGQTGYFSSDSGGVLCAECAPTVADSIPVSPAARAAMGTMLGMTMDEVAAVDLPPPVEGELMGLVRALLRCHSHGRLRSLEYLARCTATGAL